MSRFITLLFITLICSFATAEVKPPFSIERSQVITFKSTLLKRSYDLYIQLPRSFHEDPKRRYPVIFMNDGNHSFPLASSISGQLVGARKIEDLLIVGISFSNEVSWQISRTRDYTPTFAPNETNYHSAEARKFSGGAGAYLEFITEELFPYLSENYNADLTRKIYAGHSFGGLFGGYILKSAPTTFEYYIISDPSFWYDNGSIFGLKQRTPKDTNAELNVLIVASNPNPAKKVSSRLRMRENAQVFGDELRVNSALNANVQNLVFDGEIHETLFPIALSRGLRNYLGTQKGMKIVNW